MPTLRLKHQRVNQPNADLPRGFWRPPASVMLQRLPSLGRLGTDTDDRQFTDIYILDGLRAKDVGEIALTQQDLLRDVLSTAWGNGLDSLGQRILASDSRCSDKKLTALALLAAQSSNKVLSADCISALSVRNEGPIDFQGLSLEDGHFIVFDMSKRDMTNLIMKKCTFGRLIFGANPLKNIIILNSLAERVIGATEKGLPVWASVSADHFESAENTASIRRIGLKPAQQILATTLRKTFFQKGAGRKEEALTRGFARIGSQGLITKVLNLLIREGMLETARGEEGILYLPVRKNTARAARILDELNTSTDPIWLDVTSM